MTARYTDGRKVQLSAGPDAIGLAISGSRVYWREKLDIHTAVIELPLSDPARARPTMRTIGKCKPRKGAKLIEHDETMSISRAGGRCGCAVRARRCAR